MNRWQLIMLDNVKIKKEYNKKGSEIFNKLKYKYITLIISTTTLANWSFRWFFSSSIELVPTSTT